jgi:hypothetical protein
MSFPVIATVAWTLLALVGCAARQPTCRFIGEEEARAKVMRLPDVGPRMQQSSNLILDLDRGPTPDDPYYHFWFGMEEVQPPDASHLIHWYFVDPCNGKVYNGATFEEIKESPHTN